MALVGCYAIIRGNRVYIGSSHDIQKRFKQHLAALKSNKHHCRYLQNSYNFHASLSCFSFYILDSLPSNISKEQLTAREQLWLDYYKHNLGFTLFNTVSAGFVMIDLENRKREMVIKSILDTGDFMEIDNILDFISKKK